jgi:hypothetical protein
MHRLLYIFLILVALIIALMSMARPAFTDEEFCEEACARAGGSLDMVDYKHAPFEKVKLACVCVFSRP